MTFTKLAEASRLFDEQQYGKCELMLAACASEGLLRADELSRQQHIVRIHQEAAQKEWHKVKR